MAEQIGIFNNLTLYAMLANGIGFVILGACRETILTANEQCLTTLLCPKMSVLISVNRFVDLLKLYEKN